MIELILEAKKGRKPGMTERTLRKLTAELNRPPSDSAGERSEPTPPVA